MKINSYGLSFDEKLHYASLGLLQGFEVLSTDSIDDLLEEQREISFNSGNEIGYEEGYQEGIEKGCSDKVKAVNNAYSVGKREGLSESKKEHYHDGFQDGYAKGLEDLKQWL